jgi:hypothetical protein
MASELEGDRENVEWTRVGALLGDQFGVLGSDTELGRLVRSCTILLSHPDITDAELDVIRSLIDRLNTIADRTGSDDA